MRPAGYFLLGFGRRLVPEEEMLRAADAATLKRRAVPVCMISIFGTRIHG
jgi:hypothetical protein